MRRLVVCVQGVGGGGMEGVCHGVCRGMTHSRPHHTHHSVASPHHRLLRAPQPFSHATCPPPAHRAPQPFSALYWTGVEIMRAQLLPMETSGQRGIGGGPSLMPASPSPSPAQALSVNLVAGAVSGSLSAVLTTPMDVVKTQMQLRSPAGSSCQQQQQAAAGTMQTLRDIWHTAGLRGLFVGVGPRAVKAAPSCAIVIGSYELIKALL